MSPTRAFTYIALSGGVGGAKLTLGLDRLLGGRLTVVLNTGDDFEHLGLHISPDVDTALYTHADLVNAETGWGRRDESWTFMAAIAALGGPDWFRLGDGDLAMHVDRTARLRSGERLSSITERTRRHLGIEAQLIPMSDDAVRTMVETDSGPLDFQHYFVREQCRPIVRAIRFAGAERASPTAAVQAALSRPNIGGIIICPSNPYLSIDPILSVPGIRDAIARVAAPVIAVSPIVGGRAIKGPAAKIMTELGRAVTPQTVAQHYQGLIDGFVLDRLDRNQADATSLPIHVANTVMRSLDDKLALARGCIDFCDRLRAELGREQHP